MQTLMLGYLVHGFGASHFQRIHTYSLQENVSFVRLYNQSEQYFANEPALLIEIVNESKPEAEPLNYSLVSLHRLELFTGNKVPSVDR